MKNRTKFLISFILNLIIFSFEIIGLILSIRRRGVEVFLFYTEISNYFTLLISFIFIIFTIISINTNKIYPIIYYLRFVSCICLTITIIVVLFILIPMFPDTTTFLLFGDSNLYQHLLCPALSLISFLYFENHTILPRKMIFCGLMPTITYGVIMLILNLTKVIVGPYPFFYIYVISPLYSIGGILGIFIISLLTTLSIYFLYNKKFRKPHISKFRKRPLNLF